MSLTQQPEWLHWLAACPSTNTWAIENQASLNSGDVVFTPQQTAGRGQQGRVWYAPPGVLTASFILDPIPNAQLAGFSLAVGLGVIQAIESLLPHQQGSLHLKWPNDIWFTQHKLAGILCEAVPSEQAEHMRVIVGIGLNHSIDFTTTSIDLTPLGKVISLHQISDQVPSELSLLERLRVYLLQIHQVYVTTASGLLTLLPQIRVRDGLRDHPLSLQLREETITGTGAGIDDFGRLLIRLPDHRIQAFLSGRARLLA